MKKCRRRLRRQSQVKQTKSKFDLKSYIRNDNYKDNIDVKPSGSSKLNKVVPKRLKQVINSSMLIIQNLDSKIVKKKKKIEKKQEEQLNKIEGDQEKN